jgi:DNA-binding NarL/FixJ family response regulator
MEMKNQAPNVFAQILIEDSEESELIHMSLHKAGAQCEAHLSLKSLWDSLISSPSNLIIVDVRLMNSESYVLFDHPFIKNGNVEVVIFHREEDYPLLRTTGSLNVFDFLIESVNYDVFTSSLVRKIVKVMDSERKLQSSLSNVEALEKKIVDLEKSHLESKNIFLNKMRFNQFCETFWKKKPEHHEFLDCLIDVVETTNIFEQMIIIYAGENRKFLKSFASEKQFIINMPTIPLAMNSENPLDEKYIEQTCRILAKDKLGESSTMVRVYGEDKRVALFLCIKIQGV